MKIIELSIPPTRQSATHVLRRAGWELAGWGSYADVYENPDKPYVLKLFSCNDAAYRAFLQMIKEHPNVHFPRIKGNFIRVNDRYYAVRMERLHPLREDVSPIIEYVRYRLMSKEIDMTNLSTEQQEVLDSIIADIGKYPDTLRDACDLIVNKLIPPWSNDLNRTNVMKRDDGTLVFTDPVAGED